MRKIKINTESVLSALVLLGYDFIDPLTITDVLSELVKSICDKKTIYVDGDQYECEFANDLALSDVFDECFDYSFGVKLKDGYDMDANIAVFCNMETYLSLGQFLNGVNNRLLARFIEKHVDLKSILMRKIAVYGQENIGTFPNLFCDKERDILYEVFGFREMFLRRELKSTYTRAGSVSGRLSSDEKAMLQKTLNNRGSM